MSTKTIKEVTTTMKNAKRFETKGLGLSNSFAAAMASLWTIEGTPGLYLYTAGCKKDYKAKKGIVATHAGQFAVFVRIDKFEKAMKKVCA